MLAIAAKKNETTGLSIPYLEGDGMNLAFPDNTFNAVTIAFGLRNFSNWHDGLHELHRIVRPGNLSFWNFQRRSFPDLSNFLIFTSVTFYHALGAPSAVHAEHMSTCPIRLQSSPTKLDLLHS